jgi:HD-GYP domain-containing protein (c-di-GMP phosphodiesterase class II)/CHASE3 domain sensor protein
VRARRVAPGLTGRLGLTASLAAIVVVAVFVVLSSAISNLQRQTSERREALRVRLAADALQTSVLDMETGLRAFLITRDERFLEPWRHARDRLGGEKRRLLLLMSRPGDGGAAGRALARRIANDVDRYFHVHSLPLVRRVRGRRLDQRTLAAEVSEGKARVDRLRGMFARLRAGQAARTADRDAAAARAGRRAVALGVGGLVVILAVLGGGVVYLARTVTRPVVRVADAASALAAGRQERVSPAHRRVAREVRSLTECFDAMAEVVRAQSDRLRAENALLERRVLERTADLEQARYEALLMLAVAAEYRDEETHRHTQRVGRNAAFVADRLGLSEESVQLIRAAAPLHDVGKIGVSDTIMMKPARLTPNEFEAMRQHVRIGASILGSSSQPLFHVASEIALTHHEHWDGNGYLHGLSGEQIPLAGRIVAVIDVFDALTHSRPYKEAWPVDRALEEIRSHAGTHFDPEVVEAFVAIDTDILLAETIDA